MTTPEQFTPQETTERDQRLDRWFSDFFALNEFHLTELQHVLDASWMRYVRDHAFSIARERSFGPVTHLTPRAENHVDQICIQSTSVKKWSYLAPLLFKAGFEPVMSEKIEDEEHIHEVIRKWFDTWQTNYPMRVARLKQSRDQSIPTLTLDTVTYVDDIPLEKPKSKQEARQLIRRATGGEVSTVTSWVLLLQAKSGSTIELLNNSKITYSLNPMSATDIERYVDTHPTILSVPIGLDLATSAAREKHIDTSRPVSFYGKNHLGHEGTLRLQGNDLHSSVLDSYFSGVPIHSIGALLPVINDVYLYADPIEEKAHQEI